MPVPGLMFRKWPVWLALVLSFGIAVMCAGAIFIDNGPDADTAQVTLRKIGHEILLQAGDATSRVLPIQSVAHREYRIQFERPFGFRPESLVAITQKALSQNPDTRAYRVNVRNCKDSSVAYAFAVSQDGKGDIVACVGRKQPVGCYWIDIKFKRDGLQTHWKYGFLGVLAVLALGGFAVFGSAKPRAGATTESPDGTFAFGSVLFEVRRRQLTINGATTELTATETRLLHIFASSPNEIIERSRLQKEIWEDQGVIVGRSLDMFISKLRKKLEPDPKVNIVVVRARGYKLEVNG